MSLPIRLAFLDTSAIVAYFIKGERGYNNMRDLIDDPEDEYFNYGITLHISVLSVGETINTLKSRIYDAKTRDRELYVATSYLSSNTFRQLEIPNTIDKLCLFMSDVTNSIKKWARKSPVDAFLAATMETHLKHFSGPSRPFLVSTDIEFCNAIRAKKYLAYNPSEKTFKNFIDNELSAQV